MSLPLSLLDLVPVGTGHTSGDALRHSLDLARAVDRLGYARLWYAEHHGMPMIASTSPDLLVARAGMVTERIRLGAGGVMLPNHAPLVVAERWRMLEALHPGRVDLGLGRAPGTDQWTARALRRGDLGADDFPQQLAELVRYGRGTFEGSPPAGPVTACPDDVALPPLWLLGSSGFSARLGAMAGTGFSFAAHFSAEDPSGPMLAYRRGFQPGLRDEPHAILALSVICADTQAEADRLASSMELSWVRLRTGDLGKLATPEEALARTYTPAEQAAARAWRALTLIGTAEQVAERVHQLATRTQADEVMVTTTVHDPAARVRSFELLAEAWGLPAA